MVCGQGSISVPNTSTHSYSHDVCRIYKCRPRTRPDSPSSDFSDHATKWLRISVTGLTQEHYTNIAYPPFSVRLKLTDGSPVCLGLGVEAGIPSLPVLITIHNKWTNVTSEVLSAKQTKTTIEHGELLIDDWMFVDFSLAHGGYFKIHIQPLDFGDEVADWWSDKITILSAKSRPKKLRKQRRIKEAGRKSRRGSVVADNSSASLS
jgi:hypothetical protein